MSDRVGQRFGNYRLTQKIAIGGFAEVYLAEQIHLGTRTAIKILIQQLDVQKFYEEARNIAKLVHPHIVRLLDFGIDDKGGTDKTPFMVMDYAPNGTLAEKYPEGTQVPLPTVVTNIKQVASALQYAHDEKIIHRDLKPENLLIGRRNEILLSDFGIAVIAHNTRSRVTADLIGTVTYMAPEQIQKHPTPASDQYALGVIAYEWLTGYPPFDGTVQEVAVKHLTVSPDPLRVKVPTLSPAVEQVVLKALEKDPKQRFANIQSFASALEQASGSYIAPATPAIIIPSQTPVVTPAVTPSSNTAPTPPMVFSNPDELLVQQMAVSDVNPYASWGKLVLNGSKDRVIEAYDASRAYAEYKDSMYRHFYSRGKYFGDAFHQADPYLYFDLNKLRGGPFTDLVIRN
jgi:serine/threonine protein kinase